MRPILVLLLAVLAVAAPAAAARTSTRANWDVREQRTAVRDQLMAPLSDGRFHGDRPLTADQLGVARDALALRLMLPRASAPRSGTASVFTFHAVLVGQLGLRDVADAVLSEARRAGLHPSSRFGTEVVARALGLRFNHPFPRGESLEQYPWEAITRAEAAYSLAQVASFGGWEAQSVRDTFARFSIPPLSNAQRAALRVAVSRIGMPYIWGGETDGPSVGQVHGGYDCSGFAWRVFKLSGLAAGRRIGGRTADAQAHEFARRSRVRADEVRPGDVLFFGRRGYASHQGIALSRDFMIHSSGQGVYVSPLFEEWRAKSFLWGRRVL